MTTIPPWLLIVQKINAVTEDLFSKLYQICDEIGFKENARNSYCDQAHNHLMALMKEMLEEAETKKQDLHKAVHYLKEEVKKLADELKSETGLNDLEELSLIDFQSKLQNRIAVLKEKKEQRLNYLEELLEKEREICRAIGSQPTGQNKGVPSYEELENFKLYLQHQEAERNRLENTFKEMRRSIMEAMNELSISPALEFENLVCHHPDKFIFSPNNMLNLHKMRDNLKDHLDAAKEKAALKREELMDMWKCLELPEDRCQAFLDKHPGHSISDIHALNEEIKRCKQIRSENIARYVEKVREQLRKLWDLCRFDENQRKSFKPYYVQTFTENLLTLHDLELERLREYYNKNKKIYELLTERESMWEKAKELDQRANDPERLHNRGGQLLAEEKQRKIIQKKLPKIDEQLKELIQKYESVNREPFTIDGMSYNDFLVQAWDNYLEVKESIKKARAKARDKSMKKTPTMSTSRRTPTTASSLLRSAYTSAKMNGNRSPGPHLSTRRLVHSEKTRPTLVTSRVRRSGRLPRRLLPSSKLLNTSNRSAKQTEATNDTHTTMESVSQYEQFQQHLENREELRSSMLPEQVIKNVRSKSQPKMRTPVKTPVKPLRKNVSSVNTPNRTPRTSHMRDQSRSPRLMTTPRLAPTSNNMPVFF